MGNQQRLVLQTAKSIASNMRGSTLYLRGNLLGPDDTETVSEAFALNYLVWSDVLSGDTSNPDAVWRHVYSFGSLPNWWKTGARIPDKYHWYYNRYPVYGGHYDIGLVLSLFKDANELLLSSTEPSNSLESFDDFKRHLSQEQYQHKLILLEPLRELIDRWTLEGTPSDFGDIRQCFAFLTRLSLQEVPDLEQQAKSDYIDGELGLLDAYCTEEEASIIAGWFPEE